MTARVLISNDDGIGASGLRLLCEAARALTEDVWVVAPHRKWTAASHHLSFDCDLTLTRVDDRTFVCSGTPADCVIAAMNIVFANDARPDLVLAGVNDKRNVGEDVAYSGTLAIAREGAFWGIPSVALSAYDGVIGMGNEAEFVGRLVTALWQTCSDWSAGGCYLAVALPAFVPATIGPARIARDKIARACDIVQEREGATTFRLRRGRPGTSRDGDENAELTAGRIAVVRHRWDAAAPISATVVAAWNEALVRVP